MTGRDGEITESALSEEISSTVKGAGTDGGNGRPRGLPSISDYADALANPYGRFRTLVEVEPETDPRGEVRFFAGNNAAVFPVTADGRRLSLKCYIKNGLHTGRIYSYLAANPCRLISPVKLLREELFVYDVFGSGAYCDVTVAEWVEGVTLETALRRAARNDGYTFGELSAAFEDMACELLDSEWAHGDLKPENIIVRPDGVMVIRPQYDDAFGFRGGVARVSTGNRKFLIDTEGRHVDEIRQEVPAGHAL